MPPSFCLPLCFVVVLPPLPTEDGSAYLRFGHSLDGQEQAARCKAHADRLKACRGLYGYQGGFWDRCIEQTEWDRKYWELLWAAREAPPGLATRRVLQAMLEHVGPDRFRRGWSPTPLPPDETFDPSPRMPPVNPAGG